jgi:hypothetical protein
MSLSHENRILETKYVVHKRKHSTLNKSLSHNYRTLTRCLGCGHVCVTGELESSLVCDTDSGTMSSWAFKDDQDRVQQSIIGENFKNLLWIVGTVNNFNLCVQLTGTSGKQDRNGSNITRDRELLDGSSLDINTFAHFGNILSKRGDGTLGVRSFSIQGEFIRSNVTNFNLKQ